MKKEYLSDSELRNVKWMSSPVVVSLNSVLALIAWSDGVYVVTALIVPFIALMQYGQVIVIREERRREREVVFNSLKSALIEEYRNEELDSEQSEE